MLEAFAEQIEGVSHRVMSSGGDEVYARTLASVLGLALGKLAGGHSTQRAGILGLTMGHPGLFRLMVVMPCQWFGTSSSKTHLGAALLQ